MKQASYASTRLRFRVAVALSRAQVSVHRLDWDETAHPRGPGGKFAPGGGLPESHYAERDREETIGNIPVKILHDAYLQTYGTEEKAQAAIADLRAKVEGTQVAAEPRDPQRADAQSSSDIKEAEAIKLTNALFPQSSSYRDTISEHPTSSDAEAAKIQVVADLSDRLKDNVEFNRVAMTIIDPETAALPTDPDKARAALVNNYVHAWAVTSADHDFVSIAMQQAVAREFNVKEAVEPWTSYEFATASEVAEVTKFSAETTAREGGAMQAFVRAQYDATQSFLKDNKLDHVSVYRGVDQLDAHTSTDNSRQHAAASVGKTVQLTLQPASSFSAHVAVTRAFGATVFETRVPAARVLSTARTGVGCLNEFEAVLLGGKLNARFSTPEFRRQASVMRADWDEAAHPRNDKGEFDDGSTSTKLVQTDALEARGGVRLTPTNARAFSGKQVSQTSTMSKQEAGKLGEQIVLTHLQQQMPDATPFNDVKNNTPVDIFGDHTAIEVKTGLASNGTSAQQWRATIGQPGKEETAQMKLMSPDELRAHNQLKAQAILERKQAALTTLTAEKGYPVKGKTVTAILNLDTRTADVYEFEGFHLRLPWKSDATQAAYVRSYTF